VAAGDQANADSRLAVEDADTARYLAQVAATDQQIANQAEAYYQQLEKEYEAEQHRAKSTKNTHKDAKGKSGCHGLLSCAAHCVDHAASCVTHTVTHVATTAVTSTVHAAVSCVTKHSAGACVQTAVNVVLVLGTGGEGEAAEAAIEAALQAEEEATAAAEAGGATEGTTRVGRWMSQREFDQMSGTGRVVEGAGGRTYVISPPDPAGYLGAPRGSIYAEFNVPSDSLFPASKPIFWQIPGPGITTKMFGPPPLEMPPATCIVWVCSK
jgi:Tfp pilus assembly protein PilV